MMDISKTILMVDDDENLLQGVKRHLRRHLDLVTANGGPAGLQWLESHGPVAVVVSDFRMPNMNGLEFLQQVRERWPDIVLIMFTGQGELDLVMRAVNQANIYRFLTKPCPSELLEATLRDALEQYRLIMAERELTRALNRKNAELQSLNVDLEQRVESRTEDIRKLYQFVTELNGLDNLEGVADTVVATAAAMLQCRRVSLLLTDPIYQTLSVVSSVGVPESNGPISVKTQQSITGQAFAELESIVVQSKEELAGYERDGDELLLPSAPLAAVVLLTPGGPVGMLNVAEPADGRPFASEQLANLRALSEAAAIALRNQIRRRQRNEARDAIILALAKLAECRDPETGAHLERVQIYCRLLSENLADRPQFAGVINKSFVENIVRSSPLHDIGKVGIPDQILLKPGRLTPDEFEIMKRHAIIGGDTIRDVIDRTKSQDFLLMGMEIAYGHHEKWNGKGYPRGLAGEQIPLPARIMAVADVYDALTSRRVYKEPMPHDKAAAIIREDSGQHFDPDVVEAFNACEAEFRRLSVELADDLAALTPPICAVLSNNTASPPPAVPGNAPAANSPPVATPAPALAGTST